MLSFGGTYGPALSVSLKSNLSIISGNALATYAVSASDSAGWQGANTYVYLGFYPYGSNPPQTAAGVVPREVSAGHGDAIFGRWQW